jgi:hypothetical protein
MKLSRLLLCRLPHTLAAASQVIQHIIWWLLSLFCSKHELAAEMLSISIEKMTRYRRRILTHQNGLFLNIVSCFNSPAIVSCFDNFTVMSDPVEQGCGHLAVFEDLWPFAERQVGSDNEQSDELTYHPDGKHNVSFI